MRPVTVSIDVPQGREEAYDFLDVLANHAPFTDHMLENWEYSGPRAGIGSKATVNAAMMGRREVIEIEVVDAERPAKIVERNTGADGGRIANGTYLLEELPGGGTRIVFEYSWQRVPQAERRTAPLVRWMLRRGNQRSLQRLSEQLAANGTAPDVD